jgi:hypothetical protein
MENIDMWVEWMILNPELAKKNYPELMEGLFDRIVNSEPFLKALLLQKLPEHFPKWKNEAEQYIGIKRIKMIEGYIDLINIVLNKKEFPNEIEQQAFESVQIELTEQLEYWIRELKALQSDQAEVKTNQGQQSENDFILSTIEDWLFEFKEKMNEIDYQILVTALTTYFDTGSFPKLSKPIQINGRPNKKLFGWALNRIFEAKGKGIEKELLIFAKQNISLFRDVQFDENNILKSNLYKYFTTKIK